MVSDDERVAGTARPGAPAGGDDERVLSDGEEAWVPQAIPVLQPLPSNALASRHSALAKRNTFSRTFQGQHAAGKLPPRHPPGDSLRRLRTTAAVQADEVAALAAAQQIQDEDCFLQEQAQQDQLDEAGASTTAVAAARQPGATKAPRLTHGGAPAVVQHESAVLGAAAASASTVVAPPAGPRHHFLNRPLPQSSQPSAAPAAEDSSNRGDVAVAATLRGPASATSDLEHTRAPSSRLAPPEVQQAAIQAKHAKSEGVAQAPPSTAGTEPAAAAPATFCRTADGLNVVYMKRDAASAADSEAQRKQQRTVNSGWGNNFVRIDLKVPGCMMTWGGCIEGCRATSR